MMSRSDPKTIALSFQKPRLRGLSHAAFAPLALLGTAALVLSSQGQGKRIALMVYGATMVLLFTGSAVYHVGHWSPGVREWLRRVDHSNIYLLIAGTYTPVAVVLLRGGWRVGMLVAVWAVALAGVASVLPGWQMPHSVEALLYILTGWVAVVASPQIVHRVGWGGLLVLASGGLLYSIGAVVYATRRPRLWQGTFGYHELFHVFVIAATLVFFGFMVHYLVPAA
ncbi:MAG: PAQR family membrane homeostasis protein TrhA [Candidatus Dormibacteria bacterium]